MTGRRARKLLPSHDSLVKSIQRKIGSECVSERGHHSILPFNPLAPPKQFGPSNSRRHPHYGEKRDDTAHRHREPREAVQEKCVREKHQIDKLRDACFQIRCTGCFFSEP